MRHRLSGMSPGPAAIHSTLSPPLLGLTSEASQIRGGQGNLTTDPSSFLSPLPISHSLLLPFSPTFPSLSVLSSLPILPSFPPSLHPPYLLPPLSLLPLEGQQAPSKCVRAELRDELRAALRFIHSYLIFFLYPRAWILFSNAGGRLGPSSDQTLRSRVTLGISESCSQGQHPTSSGGPHIPPALDSSCQVQLILTPGPLLWQGM